MTKGKKGKKEKEEKIVMDNIHGYIKLTELETKIIQLPVFNRLHRIRQSSFAFMVYPTAQGTRFAHSIGTMKVASDIAEEILKNLSDGDKKSILGDMEEREFVEIARLAGLLHDIGHGPFSHTSERILRDVLKEVSHDEYDEGCELWGREEFPVHEFYTYKLIQKGQDLAELLENEAPSNCKQIICDVITHRSNSSNIPQEALNLLQQIITSQLDADKMDYLLRDAYISGVGYGRIDLQRIILSIRAVRPKGSEDSKYRLAVKVRGLSAVEDMIDARFKMYKWLYHHHMVVLMDVLLEKAIKKLIEEDLLDRKDLRWTTFDKGLMDDATITYILSEEMLSKRNRQLSPFLGLLDRRYAPVSLIKRPDDFERICKDISKKVGIEYSFDILKNMVETIVGRKDFEQQLKDRIRDKKPLKNVEPLVETKPRTPYSPLEEAPILILTEDGLLKEITELSPYVKSVNDSWVKFPRLYVGYVSPNKQKHEIEELKDSVREVLIELIVDLNRG